MDSSGGQNEEELRDTGKLMPGSDAVMCALSSHCLQTVPPISNPNTGEKITGQIEHRKARTTGKERHCILVVSGAFHDPRKHMPRWKHEYFEFNRKVQYPVKAIQKIHPVRVIPQKPLTYKIALLLVSCNSLLSFVDMEDKRAPS